MMKEMNHRFGFYLISILMIVMLCFIYLDVRGLSNDVDFLLEGSQLNTEFEDRLSESRNQEFKSNEDAAPTEGVDENVADLELGSEVDIDTNL